ncbi:hypothetical protein KAH37_08540 [bacterium]|nr:hypothetical protein [bacterium]
MKGGALIISLLISLLIIYGIYKAYIGDSLKKSGSTTDVVIDGEKVNIKQTDLVKEKLDNLMKKQEEALKKQMNP